MALARRRLVGARWLRLHLLPRAGQPDTLKTAAAAPSVMLVHHPPRPARRPERVDERMATKLDTAEVKAEFVLVKWIVTTVLALALATFAKQFF